MKLLVAVDFAPSTPALLNAAKALARQTGATLTLLHAAAPDPDFVGYDSDPRILRDVVAKRFHDEHRELQALAQALRDDGMECTSLLVQGATADTILREAEKLSADMIVMGSQGKGMLKKLVLGSVSEGVLRQAHVPVLVVPVASH